MGFILSLLLGFAPMLLFAGFVYWLDRYEKEPKTLLGGVFLWGAVISAGAAFLLNTFLGAGVYLVTRSDILTGLTTTSLIAPIVEETFKGFAILIVYLLFRSEFDSILDGAIYAAIVALGFAATENVYYLYRYGFSLSGYSGLFAMTLVRVILVGWQHPFYTSFTGIGLALARLSRSRFVKGIAPITGWLVAVFLHSLHNTLATLLSGFEGLLITTAIDWSGWLFIFALVIYAIRMEQRQIAYYLKEEVSLGIISPEQYRIACSAWTQSFARLSALFKGNYNITSRFYHLVGELAHKKHQRTRLMEEEATPYIEFLRRELARLSANVHT